MDRGTDMRKIEHDERMSQKNILAALCTGSPTRFWNGTLFTWHYLTIKVQIVTVYISKLDIWFLLSVNGEPARAVFCRLCR